MNREQRVREAAHAIWEAEGRPHGRDAEHWRRAEEQMAAAPPPGKQAAKQPAGKQEPAGKPDAASKKPRAPARRKPQASG